MTVQFPFPRLTKLAPTPRWSLPPAADHERTPRAPTITPDGLAAAPPPWGVCDIILVAERQRGVTHKFFHDWRFEAILTAGEPELGTVLARRPIPPNRRQTAAAVLAPIAVVLQCRAGAPNPQTPGRETFAWTLPTNRAVPDPNQPLVLALTQLRQQLRDAGWQPEGASPSRYHKPAPLGSVAGAAPALA
jgi:hypothetical protein